MEQKTPGWIRLDEKREILHYTNPTYWAMREWYDYITQKGEESERYEETFYPNLSSVLRKCLETDLGHAKDLAELKQLLTVKTAELVATVERIKPEILSSEPKVRKRRHAPD